MDKKAEQQKTFNYRFSWTDENGLFITKRFFTKKHACRETDITYTSLCRRLRGLVVPKYLKYKIDRIYEPAQIITVQQLME